MFEHEKIGFSFLREQIGVDKGITHLFLYISFNIFPKPNFTCIHWYFSKLTPSYMLSVFKRKVMFNFHEALTCFNILTHLWPLIWIKVILTGWWWGETQFLYDKGIIAAGENFRSGSQILTWKRQWVILKLSPNWELTALDLALFLLITQKRETNRFKHTLYMPIPCFANVLIV